MNQDLLPNLIPSYFIDHPNKKDFSDNGIIKVNIPVLYVLFEPDFTNSDLERDAPRLVEKLRLTLNRTKEFYLENSYGRFTFDFKVKTTLLPEQPGNYQYASEYSKNALIHVNSIDPMYPWDDNLTFEEFLDFGIPRADTHAFVFFYAKTFLVTGGVRSYYTPNRKFDISGRSLNQFVYAQHISIDDLEPNRRGWTVAAHELGHTLRTPDLYGTGDEADKQGYLGQISMMGFNGGAPHFDAFLKLRLGWIIPKIISPCKHTEVLYLGPVYCSESNCILIIPDKIGYPDEAFLLEVRRSDSIRWDGKDTLFDKSLNTDQQGVFIYHLNTLDASATEPRIDLEGDQTISGANLVAFNQTTRNFFSKEDSKFYDGNNSGLEVRIRNERNHIYELEVSWRYEEGTGEFNEFLNENKLSRIKSFKNWRKTWHTIIGELFGPSGNAGLLFYDRGRGEAQFYTIQGDGDIRRLGNLAPRFRRTWHTILGGAFGRSLHTDLFFYDQQNGEIEFYTTDGNGNMQRLGPLHREQRKTWHTIVGGSFGVSNFTEILLNPLGYTDLFFYDQQNGEAELYTTDGNGNMRILGSRHTGYRKTWHTIIGGSFGPSAYTDLLFYDNEHGVGEFYATNGAGNLRKIGSTHSGWRKSWDKIISFNTGDSRYSKLLFYDAFHGEIEIYQTNGDGSMTLINKEYGIRKSWDLIVGNITLTSQNSSVLFYDRGR